MYMRNRFNKTIMEWLKCKYHEGKDYLVYYIFFSVWQNHCLANGRSSTVDRINTMDEREKG